MTSIRVLGLDAGLTCPGIAVVEYSLAGGELKKSKILLADGFIPKYDNSQRVSDKNVERVEKIVEEITKTLELFQPQAAVIELPTGGAMSAGGIRGMAFSLAMSVSAVYLYGRKNKLVAEYITPIDNKKAGMGAETWAKDEDADKWEMCRAMERAWPGISWPRKKRKKELIDEAIAWAMADALSCAEFFEKNFSSKFKQQLFLQWPELASH